MRSILFGGLYWGLPTYGNYHLSSLFPAGVSWWRNQTQELKSAVPLDSQNKRSLHMATPQEQKQLHSPKLTWKLIWPPFRRTVVFTRPFLGFHVSFQECRIFLKFWAEQPREVVA